MSLSHNCECNLVSFGTQIRHGSRAWLIPIAPEVTQVCLLFSYSFAKHLQQYSPQGDSVRTQHQHQLFNFEGKKTELSASAKWSKYQLKVSRSTASGNVSYLEFDNIVSKHWHTRCLLEAVNFVLLPKDGAVITDTRGSCW